MFLFVVLFLLYFLFLFLLFFFFFIFCWFLYFSFFFFSSRRRHTRFSRDWSSDVCSSDLRRCPAPGPRSGSRARPPTRAATTTSSGARRRAPAAAPRSPIPTSSCERPAPPRAP